MSTTKFSFSLSFGSSVEERYNSVVPSKWFSFATKSILFLIGYVYAPRKGQTSSLCLSSRYGSQRLAILFTYRKRCPRTKDRSQGLISSRPQSFKVKRTKMLLNFRIRFLHLNITNTQFLILGTRHMMSNGRNVGIIIPNGKFRLAHHKPLRGVRRKGKVSVNFVKKIKPKICSNLNIKLRTDQPYCPLIRSLLLIVRPMEPHLRMTFL